MSSRFIRMIMISTITVLFMVAYHDIRPVYALEEPEYVFLINVEGLNHEGYISTPMKNLKQIAVEGMVDAKCLAIKADTMEAATASLLTGCLPEQHQYFSKSDRLEVESLVALLKSKGKSFLVVDGSGGKLNVFNYGEKSYISVNKGDAAVFNCAVKSMEEKIPFFTFIHVNDSMEALLSLDENRYYSTLENLDIALAEFIAWLRDQGIYERSLLIISSARASSPSNFVPLVIHAPAGKSGTLKSSLVLDIVPSICFYTGLDYPAACVGVPLYDAMLLTEDEKKYLNTRWIGEMKKERSILWERYYETRDELNSTINQLASIKEERESIFDFVGEKEELINNLKTRIKGERAVYNLLLLAMLGGYIVEYYWLKKKFLLFK